MVLGRRQTTLGMMSEVREEGGREGGELREGG